MKGTIFKNVGGRMKRRLVVPVLALIMAVSFSTYELAKPPAATAAVPPSAMPLSEDTVGAILSLDHAMEALAARVTPAVVNVTVTAKSKPQNISGDEQDQMQQFFGPFFGGQMPFGRMQQQPRVEHGLGSGIVISPDGYIVTNNHVIENATDIRVTLNDRRVLPAKLIGADPLTDLAVIKVNASNLTSVPWGDSTSLQPGQTVLAFGNPYGMRFTVTRGIVSAVHRANPFSDDPRKPGEFIQTDAAINPGNSGGALVNARGEVVGINTFLISESGSFAGMGFAIPSQLAKPIVATLMKDGKVEHAYIGIGISDVTPDNAKFFHLNEAQGALVTDVQPDSPGAKAGLKTDDVITGIDGQKVTDAGELQLKVSEQHPGSRITLSVLRDGKTLTVPVTVQLLNEKESASGSSSESHGKARWGVGISDMNSDVRDQLNAPADLRGAVITNVEPGSPADIAGLARGDVILEVNRHKVQDAAQAKKELNDTAQGQDALVLVWSPRGNAFVVMHPAEKQQG